MNKYIRRRVIAGNWKMNNTRPQTKQLIKQLIPIVTGAGCEIVVCVPFTDLETAVQAVKSSGIKVGAQNCHFADFGAFTGEISASMLVEIGTDYVIIGHSERRQYFGETDATVNKRTRTALNAGLTVILCVGEVLDERELNITQEVVERQLKIALNGVSAEELSKIIVAYEPVWAIGTGKTATYGQANEVNAFIREQISQLYGDEAAQKFIILYGGSMNAKNASGLLAQPDVDGGLIGGASLKAEDFATIVTAASS